MMYVEIAEEIKNEILKNLMNIKTEHMKIYRHNEGELFPFENLFIYLFTPACSFPFLLFI